MEQPPEHLQVLAAGQDLVDSGELPGQAEQLATAGGVAARRPARRPRPARVGLEQRGEHADERGLARSVGPQQPEDGALRDLEVDTRERQVAPKRFVTPCDVDCGSRG